MSYFKPMRREEVALSAALEDKLEETELESGFVWLPREPETSQASDKRDLFPCDACGRSIDLAADSWSGSPDGQVFCAACVTSWQTKPTDAPV